jgi:Bifunctional DNA primase/polymerase, N-terminal
MSDRPENTLDQALAYARSGWPVFPCRSGSKEPATRHGFRDASTDPSQIRSWWRRQPAANLAIATGRPGPDVLDVDQHGPAGSGFAAFRRLRDEGLLDTVSVIVVTPGGGLHAYFTGSDQQSGRLPSEHLDFRARGGYVLAPPSQVNGRPYRLIAHGPPSGGLDWAAVTTLLSPAPGRAARARAAAPDDFSHLAAWVGRLQEGNRNAGLYWAARRAVEAGQPAVLDDLARAAAATGLTGREIARTISSARRGSQRPFEHQGGREAAP